MRNIIIIALLTLLLSSAFAVSFDGDKKTFSELNLNQVILDKGNNCATINTQINDMNNNGILGMLLHANFSNIDSNSRIVIKDQNGLPIRRTNYVGFDLEFTYSESDFQNGYLFIDLEDLRLRDNITLSICGYLESDTITLENDSSIGFYKIPYFGCKDCFTKQTLKSRYKVGETTPIVIRFKNKGFSDINVNAFYDTGLFRKWFKLKQGEPSWNGNIKVNEDQNFVYNLEPQITENFIISPASISYTYNDYRFDLFSNPIIIGTTPYLDTISCQLEVNKRDLVVGEDTSADVILYNDTNNIRDFTLIYNLNGQSYEQDITLDNFKSKIVAVNITSDKEQIVDLNVSLKKDNLNKICGTDTIGFSNKTNNYQIIMIIILIMLGSAAAIYYRFFL